MYTVQIGTHNWFFDTLFSQMCTTFVHICAGKNLATLSHKDRTSKKKHEAIYEKVSGYQETIKLVSVRFRVTMTVAVPIAVS